MSKKGAALYNKIRNGGYGSQFTGTYSEPSSGNRHWGAGSYSARISSGNHNLPGTKYVSHKKPKKKMMTVKQKKTLNLKKKKNNNITNPWFRYLAENNVSEKSVNSEVKTLRKTGDIEIIEKYYSPEFKVKPKNPFDLQIWVLPNIAIIPKRSLYLKKIRYINLVNCGIEPIFVAKKSLFVKDQGLPMTSQTIQPGDHTFFDLKYGNCYLIGFGQTIMCRIYK